MKNGKLFWETRRTDVAIVKDGESQYIKWDVHDQVIYVWFVYEDSMETRRYRIENAPQWMKDIYYAD